MKAPALFKDFIPPIVIKAARRIRPKRPELYSSYAAAAAACGTDYEDPNLIEVIFKKTEIYRDQLFTEIPFIKDFPSVLSLFGTALAAIGEHAEVNVIDFGGACGGHYFTAKAVFRDRLRFRWYVVETPAMVKRAREIETDELKFYDDLAAAQTAIGQIDLLHSSGTLQFVPLPYETLEMLLNCNARVLMLQRLALTTGIQELITVQRTRFRAHGYGPLPAGVQDGASCVPCQYMRQSRFEDMVTASYRIVAKLRDDSGLVHLPSQPIVGAVYVGSRLQPEDANNGLKTGSV